jgi:hypothetical protein
MVVFASATGWYISKDVWNKHLLGKDGFLKSQAAYFDKYLANVSSPAVKFLEYTLFMAAFFALYEGLAFLLSLIFGVKRINDVTTAPHGRDGQ